MAGEGSKVTEKINSVIEQTSSLVKFLLQIIAAIGVVSGIILYPLMARVNMIETSINSLDKKIETKVDEKIYSNALSNIQKSLDEMKTDIKWLVRRGNDK